MESKKYIGISLEHLSDDTTRELKVWIPELSPFTTDDPSEETLATTKTLNTAQNEKHKSMIKIVSYVVCEYYGNTKISRPNIHVGEHVEVTVYEDNNIYFWDVIGRDDKLRTTEYHKIMISNKFNQLDPLNSEDNYYLELDTRSNRRVKLHLGQGTNEAVGYDLIFDMEKSTVTLQDTVGNFFKLDSLATTFLQQIANGEFIKQHPGRVLVHSPLLECTGHILSDINNITLSTHKHPGTGSHYDVNMVSPKPNT
jgi:hypothetical protein